MPRHPAGWLERILADGTYARLAAECETDAEIGARLGTTGEAVRKARQACRARGLDVPTCKEARRSKQPTPVSVPGIESVDVDISEWDDEPTQESKPKVEVCAPNAVAPLQPAIPDSHFIKGVSTLLDAGGNVRAQWIKSAVNDETLHAVEDAVRKLAEPWPEIAALQPAPAHSDDDLLCVYPMGDPHIGMLAWSPESGENFDLEIAERNLFAAVDHLVDLAPPARRALVATVGDTLHSDGYANTTTRGTRVDVDGRTPKMVNTALRTFRRVIYRALQKHQEVEVKVVPGNHDMLMTLVLSIALQQFFEDEPRVHIDASPAMYQWYRFGQNLIGITHGDKAKPDGMMGVMAVDRAKDWGETAHRRIYAGHIHHEVVKEVPGVIVEHLRTLASKDAWHAGMGYRSGRDMKLDVFHREDGHINRHIVGIQAIKRRAA